MPSSRIFIWQHITKLTPEEVQQAIPLHHPIWVRTEPDDIAFADRHATPSDLSQRFIVGLGMSRPGPMIPPLLVTDAQRVVLEGWLRRRATAQALTQRSRIVLECAEGHSVTEVSRRLRVAPDTVRTWRRRFIEHGLDGLGDEPRPGVPRKITDEDVERVIVKTLESTPKNATHWRTGQGRWPGRACPHRSRLTVAR